MCFVAARGFAIIVGPASLDEGLDTSPRCTRDHWAGRFEGRVVSEAVVARWWGRGQCVVSPAY